MIMKKVSATTPPIIGGGEKLDF